MRIERHAIAVLFGLVGCAGGDTLGPAAQQSPFYGQPGVGGGDTADEPEDTGDAATDESGNPTPEPSPDDPPPDDPSGAADDGGGNQPPPPPQPTGDCCTPTATPGCVNDPNIETCVCQIDDWCCTNQWDEDCVAMIGLCAEPCPGVPVPQDGGSESGGSDGGGAASDCCGPTGMPGCSDPGIADCVCQIDGFCCAIEWDDLCAEIATDCGC